MKFTIFISIYLIILFSLLGCSKEKSHNWLVVEINASNAWTGEPISGVSATVCYYSPDRFFGGQNEGPITIGTTGVNGYLYKEWKIPKRAKGIKLHIVPSGIYAHPGLGTYVDCEQNNLSNNVSTRALNTYDVSYYPFVPFQLHFVNTNCYNNKDSVITTVKFDEGPYSFNNINSHQEFNFKFYGCIDTLLNQNWMVTQSPKVVITTNAYKNGVHTFSEQAWNLNMDGSINTFEIDY